MGRMKLLLYMGLGQFLGGFASHEYFHQTTAFPNYMTTNIDWSQFDVTQKGYDWDAWYNPKSANLGGGAHGSGTTAVPEYEAWWNQAMPTRAPNVPAGQGQRHTTSYDLFAAYTTDIAPKQKQGGSQTTFPELWYQATTKSVQGEPEVAETTEELELLLKTTISPQIPEILETTPELMIDLASTTFPSLPDTTASLDLGQFTTDDVNLDDIFGTTPEQVTTESATELATTDDVTTHDVTTDDVTTAGTDLATTAANHTESTIPIVAEATTQPEQSVNVTTETSYQSTESVEDEIFQFSTESIEVANTTFLRTTEIPPFPDVTSDFPDFPELQSTPEYAFVESTQKMETSAPNLFMILSTASDQDLYINLPTTESAILNDPIVVSNDKGWILFQICKKF
jgi:hypothetical protein